MKRWDIAVILCLLFTALVTPYEVAFLDTALDDSLFAVNRLVDLVFVKDICLQFFLKVQVSTKQGTVLIKDQRSIVRRYLKGWFTVDFLACSYGVLWFPSCQLLVRKAPFLVSGP